MRTGRALLPLAILLLAATANAASAPSQMMANVFRFAEAGAVLQLCYASEAYKALPPEKAARMRELGRRLADLVAAIGEHYGDATLPSTYDATRERISLESRLRLHVKNHYRYCGDNLAEAMEKYVAENESLLYGYFKAQALKAPAGRPQPR